MVIDIPAATTSIHNYNRISLKNGNDVIESKKCCFVRRFKIV